MTSEQLAQLKSWTPQERVKHFWDKKLKGEINISQYAEAVKFCSSLEREDKKLEPKDDSHEAGEAVDVLMPPDTVSRGSEHVGGEALAQAFGGYIVHEEPEEAPEKKLSQKARLLKLLQDMQWQNTNEIQRVVYGAEHLGSARVAARIADLKKDGWKIEGQDVTATLYEYRLELGQFKLV